MTAAPDNATLAAAFAHLSTALIADACLRVRVPVRALPQTLRPLAPFAPFAGRALPARHAGSVDIFLEALNDARRGDVAVIDNDGRTDEACIGDLVALEMHAAGLAGVIIGGCHRDSAELAAIGLPVLSLGSCPAGPPGARPRAADALTRADVGDVTVRRDDIVFADADGVVVVSDAAVGAVLDVARRQCARAGRSAPNSISRRISHGGRRTRRTPSAPTCAPPAGQSRNSGQWPVISGQSTSHSPLATDH